VNRTRSAIADVLVAFAVFIVAVWLLRRVIGMILWLAGLIALVIVVVGLLSAARWLKRGGG
jgi:thiol:disulfide interchange protein